MSTYSDASLIFYPSGYKESKLYSLKPTDGSGDLTFTRASSATRVNAEGLIEGVRTNLLTYSEQFDDAAWSKTNCTITANDTTAPDGTLTADRITATSSGQSLTQFPTLTSGQPFVFSVFVKEGNWGIVRIGNASSATNGAWFNVTNGTAGTINGGTSEIIDYGNGWYRLIAKFTSFSSGISFIALSNADGSTTTSAIDTFMYLWGAQIETGGIATEYIPTTTTAVSVGITNNIPRIDYTGGGCGKLLLEPQRTNLVFYSEDFSNAYWTKQGGITATYNTTETLSPNGTYNATKFVGNGTTGVLKTSISVSGVVSRSVYLKSVTGTTTATFKEPNTNVPSPITLTITNEWQRFEMIGDNGSSLQGLQIDDITSDGIYMWGAQLEAGSYPTSYIPTTSTAVTRVADNATKSGISSLIGQTEGTLFAEFTPTSDINTDVISLVATTPTDNLVSIACGSGYIYAVVYTNPNYRFGPSIAQTIPNNTFKVALCYKNNDFTFFINGVKVASGANSYSPSSPLTRMNFNEAFFFGNQVIDYKSVLVFPAKLSDADAIALTA